MDLKLKLIALYKQAIDEMISLKDIITYSKTEIEIVLHDGDIKHKIRLEENLTSFNINDIKMKQTTESNKFILRFKDLYVYLHSSEFRDLYEILKDKNNQFIEIERTKQIKIQEKLVDRLLKK